MSSMKDVVTVKDSITFELYKTDLTEKNFNAFRETAKRNVPRSDGLQWWARSYPAGDRDTAKGYVSVYLYFNKPIKAKYSFTVNDAPSISTFTHTHEFSAPWYNCGCAQFASHEILQPWFRDGKVTITCSLETEIEVPFTLSVPRNFQLFDHIPTDVEIVVESESIPAHKNFISMISPVFNSMFSNDTSESKSKKANIIDFDYGTVKSALDICYGRELEECSLETMVSILRFADKYLITAIVNQHEKLPLLNLSVETFCTIVHYAYDCNKDDLLTECCNFFKEHQDKIKIIDKFAKLPPALVVDVLKSAFDLKTDFDVLSYVYMCDVTFVMEFLEQPFLEQITIENFCPVVEYAWECSRDDLKKACAEFYNENLVEILNLKDFCELPSETIGEIAKFCYNFKNGIQL